MKVIWSPLALEKLGQQADYIALDKPSAAEKWVNDVFDKTEMIGNQPEMGRLVPELGNTLYREILIGNYRVIYKINDAIKILTVRSCRQNLTIDDTEL